MKKDFRTKDDAVSSVVGEMLLLTIALILAAVFAVSAFSFLPGDREDVVDVDAVVDKTAKTITFWHKGGDVIAEDRLTPAVYHDGTEKRTLTKAELNKSNGDATTIFDLGAKYTITVNELASGDEIRLSTDRSIIYTGVVE